MIPIERSDAAGRHGRLSTRASIDWEAIELDYRAGFKTLRQMAAEHGITHGAINKRARANSWERDLSEKIQQKAESLVSKALVSNEVSTESKVSEKQIIEAGAQALVTVRLAHRKDIHRSRTIVMRLMDELELQVGPENVSLLEELGELLRRGRDSEALGRGRADRRGVCIQCHARRSASGIHAADRADRRRHHARRRLQAPEPDGR